VKYINWNTVAFFCGFLLALLFVFVGHTHTSSFQREICKPAPTVEIVPIAVQTLVVQVEEQRKYRKAAEDRMRALQSEAYIEEWEEDAKESDKMYLEARQDLVKRGLLKEENHDGLERKCTNGVR